MTNDTAVTDRVRQLDEDTDEESTGETIEIEIDDLDLVRTDELNQVMGADMNQSPESPIIATDELKQLLDPSLENTESRTVPDLGVEDDGDDAGFDPYNRG